MTGVPAATLRAWERRYGIPSPQRTGSDYRVYTALDVEAVRRVLASKAKGMAASQAAKLARQWLEGKQAKETAQTVKPDGAHASLRAELLESIRSFDYVALEKSIARLMFVGSACTTFDEVLAPVQVSVGDMWHEGKISVGQEHMATQLLEGAARNLLGLLQVPDDARNLVMACYPTEAHSLPIYGVAFRAVKAGLRPVLLGPSTPASAIAAAHALDPIAFALSITVTPAPHQVRQETEALVRAAADVPVVVGGSGAQRVAEIIEAAGATVVPSSVDGITAMFGRLRARTSR